MSSSLDVTPVKEERANDILSDDALAFLAELHGGELLVRDRDGDAAASAVRPGRQSPDALAAGGVSRDRLRPSAPPVVAAARRSVPRVAASRGRATTAGSTASRDRIDTAVRGRYHWRNAVPNHSSAMSTAVTRCPSRASRSAWVPWPAPTRPGGRRATRGIRARARRPRSSSWPATPARCARPPPASRGSARPSRAPRRCHCRFRPSPRQTCLRRSGRPGSCRRPRHLRRPRRAARTGPRRCRSRGRRPRCRRGHDSPARRYGCWCRRLGR